MVRRWRIFGDFLRPVLSASRVQHISDMHSKFALRPHRVWQYGRHPLRIGEEKEKKKKKTTGRKYNGLTYWVAIIN